MSIDVGVRLQAIRKRNGWSQRELAKRAGVTNSTISVIEQGQVSPSVGSLKKVLDGIPMALGDFFTLDIEHAPSVFYEAGEMPEIGSDADGDVSRKLVGADIQGRSVSLLYEKYPAGSDTGTIQTSCEGEVSGIVIAGELEVTVGGESKELSVGEGFFFHQSRPYRMRNLSKSESIIVCASSASSV